MYTASMREKIKQTMAQKYIRNMASFSTVA